MELQELLESCASFADDYKYAIIGAILALGLGFGGVHWYRVHRTHVEQHANDALVACIDLLNARVGTTPDVSGVASDLSFATDTEKWERVACVAQESYEVHKSAGIAGVFCAIRAQALTELGRFDAARAAMHDSVVHTVAGPLHEWYRFYAALRAVDGADTATHENGLRELTLIAGDQQSIMADGALAELGEYYWSQGDVQQARTYWNTLAVAQRDKEKRSPWYDRIKPKLKLLQV